MGGILNYVNLESKIIQDTLSDGNAIANIQEDRINDIIDRNFERLSSITSRTQLRLSLDAFNQDQNDVDAKKIRNTLNDALKSISDFKSITIFDLDKNMLFSTMSFQSYDFLSENIFPNSNKQHLRFTKYQNDAIMILSAPLVLDGKVIGIIAITSSPQSITNITNDYTGLGESGESFLAMRNTNGDALFITPLRFDPGAQLNRTILSTQTDVPITRALAKVESEFKDTIDYRGVEVLSSSKYIDKTDWGLVVKIDKEEAFAPLFDIQLVTGLSVGFTILLSLLISNLLSNRLSGPIIELQKSTKEIARGTLDHDIIIKSNDELEELATSFNKMKSDLKENQKNKLQNEKLKIVGELSSRISHDLRNPLSVIISQVQLFEIRNKEKLSEKDKETLGQILLAADRMKHQINNVLDYIKDTPLKKESKLLSEILDTVLKTTIIPDNISIKKPEKDIYVYCDLLKMEVVFINLIRNAIHAIKKEGTITISADDDEHYTIIEFIDDGEGIPNNVLDKIFEPMFTTKQEGTGLGLVTCKRIVEQHGGTIKVKNNPTMFSISLPKS
ncbi:MAG: sensor histidine kinase [Candidatus Nitrosopumilus sp. bin_6a]